MTVTMHCRPLHTKWCWPRSTGTPPGQPSSSTVGQRSATFASSEHMTGKPAARTPPPALLRLAVPPHFPRPLRGIVPCSSIQQFTGVLPTPPNLTGSKVKEWNNAVTELKQYLENVQRAGTVSFPTTVTTEPPRGPAVPVKVCRVQCGVGGVQQSGAAQPMQSSGHAVAECVCCVWTGTEPLFLCVVGGRGQANECYCCIWAPGGCVWSRPQPWWLSGEWAGG